MEKMENQETEIKRSKGKRLLTSGQGRQRMVLKDSSRGLPSVRAAKPKAAGDSTLPDREEDRSPLQHSDTLVDSTRDPFRQSRTQTTTGGLPHLAPGLPRYLRIPKHPSDNEEEAVPEMSNSTATSAVGDSRTGVRRVRRVKLILPHETSLAVPVSVFHMIPIARVMVNDVAERRPVIVSRRST